jgi:hypothetical protein
MARFFFGGGFARLPDRAFGLLARVFDIMQVYRPTANKEKMALPGTIFNICVSMICQDS